VVTSSTITIAVTAPTTSGVITNTASVASASPDPDTGNNDASAVTTVVQTTFEIYLPIVIRQP